jgi:hypothetical protein
MGIGIMGRKDVAVMKKGGKMSPKMKQKFMDGLKKRRDYSGPNNPKWRGGKTIMADGRTLIYAPDHPDANAIGGLYILEYRLVAEKKIGRRLTSDEVVHHINGDATDNRPENIEVMTKAEHARMHTTERHKTIRRFGEA